MYRKRLASEKGSTLLRIGFVVGEGGRERLRVRACAYAPLRVCTRVARASFANNILRPRIEIKIHRLLSASQKTYDIPYIPIFRTGGAGGGGGGAPKPYCFFVFALPLCLPFPVSPIRLAVPSDACNTEKRMEGWCLLIGTTKLPVQGGSVTVTGEIIECVDAGV